MNKATLLTLPSLLAALLTPVLSCGEDFLLYTPKPAEGDKAPASPDQGVLVRRITVKRGDTLADLSRKYIGRGSWFPQVLLFNSIKNPDLIYIGDKLLVPVPPGKAAAAEKKGAPERKHAKGKKHHAKKRHKAVTKTEKVESGIARPEAAKPETIKPETIKRKASRSAKARRRHVASGEQESFLQAKLAYMKGDYQKSLALFTEFLGKYPHSTSTPDASLYRADCLMHLSGQ